jgi:(p)ppGpp synthase/HD superfamily hydrolase
MNITEQLELAKHIANEAFKNKKDRAAQPYINHIQRVADGCAEIHCKAIAYLHDLLEDCPEWTEAALRQLFIPLIVDTVVILTKRKDDDYFEYIRRVRGDRNAVFIKVKDLEDNMNITRLNCLDDKDVQRLKKYHQAYIMLKNAYTTAK